MMTRVLRRKEDIKKEVVKGYYIRANVKIVKINRS